MSAIPSLSLQDMDASHLDDKMDVASSPFRPPDDFDVDLDSVRDPSVIESLHDDMVDDPEEPADAGNDLMQDQIDENLPDDFMIDEPISSAPTRQTDVDYNMDTFIDGTQADEDEDILYEEEDVEPTIQQGEDTVEVVPDGEQHNYQQDETEVILADFEEQPVPPDETNPAPIEEEVGPTEQIPSTVEGIEKPKESFDMAPISAGETLDQGVEQRAGQGDLEHGPIDQGQVARQDYPSLDDDQTEQAETTDHLLEPQDTDQLQGDDQQIVGTEMSIPHDTVESAEYSQHEDTEPVGSAHDASSQTVHPVTLVYLEEEMSLFPPMVGDGSNIYFLQDSSLAFEPLDKLLAACREILAGTLDHHDELVLDIPGLGLHICEDSKYAAQITLSQILDVYLHLCHNDQGHDVQPLYCHLSSRVSLASQYAYLSSAGVEGKTFSEIAAGHLDTPGPEGDQNDAADYHRQPEETRQESPVEHHQAVEENSKEEPTVSQPENEDDTEIAAGPQDLSNNETTTEEIGQSADYLAIEASPNGYTAELDRSETLPAEGEPEQTAPDENGHVSNNGHDQTEDQIDDFGAHSLEQEQYPEDLDHQHVEGHENETSSSHTVEADAADTGTRELEDDELEVDEGPDFVDQSNGLADGLLGPDEGSPQPDVNPESYSDEELFAPGENEKDLSEDASNAIQDEAQVATLPDTSEQDSSQNDDWVSSSNIPQSGSTQSQPASAADLQPVSVESPPVTPSKRKQAKRKAEDDDELYLLDFDTPEPKRRRPS
ncbi:uncharacterized protein Z518_02598 [Rhinocladiella mackenziei CBS 650.93]|uniref:Uncharacterized protein n=1 Tax=Rhinocladiella mackenziei CBS 650.93 TaxID=1442369 RepID=A0A0D2IPY4_9EURO|nr:uncharacterized protein Z518_02598 [Rhinocladiella mackenziei CBS 650.93]KIX07944.1 hypothetical protein Z518_02598 [Rhinocladiella mackenziei CBS 650.93]